MMLRLSILALLVVGSIGVLVATAPTTASSSSLNTIQPAAGPVSNSALSINNGWVRASTKGMRATAGYMELYNPTDTDKILIGGESSAAERVELHTHITDPVTGRMQMQKLNNMTIPAYGELMLAPGGRHIMLIGIQRELLLGNEIDLKLKFADGTFQTTKLKIEALGHRPDLQKMMKEGK